MIIAHATLADGRENAAAATDGATIDSNPFCSRIIKNRQFTILYVWLLGRWDKQIVDQASDVPIIIFLYDFLQNSFNLFSYFFYKITKIKIKSFECPKSIKSIK